MATYSVTIDNWNNAKFWSGLDGSGGGHVLSFADLPAGFTVDLDEVQGRILISDGSRTFTVGTPDYRGPADAILPRGTTLADFPNLTGSQGGDLLFSGEGADSVGGGAGDDIITGGSDGDRLDGGTGDDIVAGDSGAARLVAATDFSDGVPDWITTPGGKRVTTLGKLEDGNVFLGPFEGDGKGGETVRATFDFDKGAATGVITFDFVQLDSWDDDTQWGVDERLVIHIDGASAFGISPQWDQLPSGSFDGGRWEVWPATEQMHLGGNGKWTDRIFTVRIVLDEPAPSVAIGFGATTNQGIEDESWGIDSIRALSLGPQDGRGEADVLLGGDGADLLIGGAGDDRLDGGEGNDSLEGGAGDDRITTGGGRDTIVLSRGGGTDTVTDFASWDWGDVTEDRIDISALRGGSGPDGRVVWRDIVVGRTREGDAVLGFPEGERLILMGVPPERFDTWQSAQATGIPCFTAGTLIRTPSGETPIERLGPGDLVLTRDDGPQPLRWLAMRRVGSAELAAQPELRPVRIAPGTLGNARPLLVSPQHGLVVGLAARGGGEGFARAIQLARMRGGKARIAAGVRSVTYLHMAFDRHEVVFANGIATESFHPGPRALDALAPMARADFDRLFPDPSAYGGPARRYLGRADLPGRIDALPVPGA
jgi:hypothetical protein